MNEVCRVVERLAVAKGNDSLTGIFNIGAGESQTVLSMTQPVQQRCVQVLGFEPVLQRKQDVEEDSFVPFIYRTARLDELETPVDTNDNITEIDCLLRYCATTFKQTQSYDS